MENFLKLILVIPMALSIRAALTLKDKVNVKRSIAFLTIGAY